MVTPMDVRLFLGNAQWIVVVKNAGAELHIPKNRAVLAHHFSFSCKETW